VGRDTVEVLSEAGVSAQALDDLLARKAASPMAGEATMDAARGRT
jgi:hypothetical protein